MRCHEVHGLLSEKCILIQGNLLSDCNPDTVIENVVDSLLSKEHYMSREYPSSKAKSITLSLETPAVKKLLNWNRIVQPESLLVLAVERHDRFQDGPF